MAGAMTDWLLHAAIWAENSTHTQTGEMARSPLTAESLHRFIPRSPDRSPAHCPPALPPVRPRSFGRERTVRPWS